MPHLKLRTCALPLHGTRSQLFLTFLRNNLSLPHPNMGMLRAVFFCAMLAVAQSQTYTCQKVSRSITGGMCDGVKVAVGACWPAGTIVPVSELDKLPALDGKDLATGCTSTTAMCAPLGGTVNTAYCAAGGGMPFLSSFRLCCRLCLQTFPHACRVYYYASG